MDDSQDISPLCSGPTLGNDVENDAAVVDHVARVVRENEGGRIPSAIEYRYAGKEHRVQRHEREADRDTLMHSLICCTYATTRLHSQEEIFVGWSASQ